MLFRLDSQLGKFPARLRRLVAKPRDLALLLAGLGAKSNQLRVGGPVFAHKLEIYETPTARATVPLGPPGRHLDPVSVQQLGGVFASSRLRRTR
jgi:hypothetical protein